jgi:hypothetical protein
MSPLAAEKPRCILSHGELGPRPDLPIVRMDSRTRRPKALWLLLGFPAALVLAVFAFDSIWGGGHPSLSALLLFWGSYPTLAGYLSRALSGSDFPSPLLMLLGFLEYPLKR